MELDRAAVEAARAHEGEEPVLAEAVAGIDRGRRVARGQAQPVGGHHDRGSAEDGGTLLAQPAEDHGQRHHDEREAEHEVVRGPGARAGQHEGEGERSADEPRRDRGPGAAPRSPGQQEHGQEARGEVHGRARAPAPGARAELS
jgi:hypothetical protein